MKKSLPILIVLIMISLTGFSQYYYIPWINAGHNPGNLNNDAEQPATAGWTAICNPSATPIWSSVATIPWSFNFNGTGYTQFKVSTSGVLTFTTAAATVPSSTSATIPNANIPNNSVCVWGLSGFGANDSIKTKVFGTSPNRQEWIQFVSYDCPNSTGWTYWSIVLEETTNKIYIVDHRSYNAPLALTLGIQINSTTAIQVAGSPTIGSNATTTADPSPIDNTYYEFIYGTQPANDAALTAIAPTAGSSASYAVVPGSISITGTIKNLGTASISSIFVKYNDGSGPVSYTFTTPIASLASGNFTCATPYAPTAGPHNLKVYVQLAGDANQTNDTLTTVLTGATFMPVHKVTVEEETGTWCGWCVRGLVMMDSLKAAYPNTTELVAVHNADPMTVTAYDAGATSFPGFTGFPSIEVDRKSLDDPSYIFDEYTAHIGDFAVADITVAASLNWTTRVATINAGAHFAVPVSPTTGAYNLALVMTEDGVHSTASTSWDQHNYYSSTNQNIYLPSGGSGYFFQSLTDPVPAAQMWYPDVARAIQGTYTGTAGSLPATIAAGSTQNYTFSYTVPATYNYFNMKAIVLLINTTTGQILNANHATLTHTGITEVNSSINSLNIYPNPFNASTNIAFELNKAENVKVVVTNLMGAVVFSSNGEMMSEGAHNIVFNGGDLSSGLYFVTLKTGDNSITQKISIQK